MTINHKINYIYIYEATWLFSLPKNVNSWQNH